MPMRYIIPTVLLIAAGCSGAAAQDAGERAKPAPNAEGAVLQAPIGHRQPTLSDLPSWLRHEETGHDPAATQDAHATDGMQRRQNDVERRDTERARDPYTGVPRICQGC